MHESMRCALDWVSLVCNNVHEEEEAVEVDQAASRQRTDKPSIGAAHSNPFLGVGDAFHFSPSFFPPVLPPLCRQIRAV